MNILFVIDLQREFVKDRRGQAVYDKLLEFIRKSRLEYDSIYAAVYKNGRNKNMSCILQWNEMRDIVPLDFRADKYFVHSGYYPNDVKIFSKDDKVTIVGFDTDACVLSACFALWNDDIPIKILANGCYSSGGKKMHEAGLDIMLRQFGKALDVKTSID